jgi:transposase InsO family protein
MSRVVSASTGRPYGLKRVARLWRVPRSTVYAHRRRRAVPDDARPAPRRPGPQGPCDDATLLGHIRKVLADSPFHGEGYRKVWARLRFQGMRTSKERVRRLMREHGLQAPHRVGHAHGPKAHDRTIIPDKPNVMWGADLTGTVTTRDGAVGVFVAVDHHTAECVGIHAAVRCTRFEALEPIRQGVRDYFGGFGENVARGLTLRHDHGSQYLADDFQAEIRFLGIASSPAFVREPEGNGCVERFIRTLKENLLWVRTFETVEDLRQALLEFKRQYNDQWILERLGYRTPAQARKDACSAVEVAA